MNNPTQSYSTLKLSLIALAFAALSGPALAAITTNNQDQEVVLVLTPGATRQAAFGVATINAATDLKTVPVQAINLSAIPSCNAAAATLNNPAQLATSVRAAAYSAYLKNAQDTFTYLHNPNYPAQTQPAAGSWLASAVSSGVVPQPENIGSTLRGLGSSAWNDSRLSSSLTPANVQRRAFMNSFDSAGKSIQTGASEALEIFTCDELRGVTNPPSGVRMPTLLRSQYGYVGIAAIPNPTNGTVACAATQAGDNMFPIPAGWLRTVSGSGVKDCVPALRADVSAGSVIDYRGRAATALIESASCAIR